MRRNPLHTLVSLLFYLKHVIDEMIMYDENDNCVFQGRKKAVLKAIELSMRAIDGLQISDFQSRMSTS